MNNIVVLFKQLFYFRLLQSASGKKLIANFTSLGTLQVANYILPFLTLPYLVRTIGSHNYGLLALSGSITIYFQTIIDYGFNYSGTRDIAVNKENKEKIETIFSCIISSKIFLLIISFFFLVLSLLTVPLFRQNSLLIILSFLYLPGLIIFPDWLFQGLQEMRYISFINIVSKLFVTVMVFVVIKKPTDYLLLPVLNALACLISGSLAIYIIIRQKIITSFYFSSLPAILKTLREGFNLFLNQFVPNLYNSLSTIILSSYSTPSVVGYLEAARRVMLIPEQLILLLSRTFFPFLNGNIAKHSYFAKLLLSTSLFLSLLVFFTSAPLVEFIWGNEFSKTIFLLKWLAITPFFFACIYVYGVNYLIIINKERVLRNITLTASLTGFVGCLLLIPRFNVIAVVWVLLLSRGIIGIGAFLYTVKFKNK